MSDRALPELTMDHLAEFHQQLIRMDRAGLKIQLDESGPVSNLSDRLNEIMANLATQMGKSQPLEQVLATLPSIPQRYRLALTTYYPRRSVESLDLLRAPVRDDLETSADARLALLLPTIALSLIYLASFYLLFVTLPHMEATYVQLNEPPSMPVRCLISVRDAMPFWVPAVPLLILIVWWLLVSGRATVPRWMPGRVQSFKYLMATLYARNLARDIEQTQGPQMLERLQPHTGVSAAALRSPMFRWALSETNQVDTAAPVPLANQQMQRLYMVAHLYESMHSIHVQRFRFWFILLTCIFLGGGLVLLYCLALFVPLIQLLYDIVG